MLPTGPRDRLRRPPDRDAARGLGPGDPPALDCSGHLDQARDAGRSHDDDDSDDVAGRVNSMSKRLWAYCFLFFIIASLRSFKPISIFNPSIVMILYR